ncbi:MAG TPA: sigma-70 family RNA polymerase sigma factor [Candidatus Binataceae bacterium]|nr:sigma-70 family RNA polymerase sigma factor [Candidatus Binataceae bacterium]
MAAPSQTAPSDRQLVNAMAAGDAHALQALSARYGRMLTALASRFLSDEADAEEVVADVLWQAWSESKSYDPARGSVGAWLVMLARSRAIDRLRAKKARARLSGEEPSEHHSPDPAVEVDVAERAQSVRTAVAGLEMAERTALELAYFSDLSQSQIAERLGIPLGTVKTRIRGAMIKLREALSGRQA